MSKSTKLLLTVTVPLLALFAHQRWLGGASTTNAGVNREATPAPGANGEGHPDLSLGAQRSRERADGDALPQGTIQVQLITGGVLDGVALRLSKR